jgi:hypothetical protein
MSVGKDSDMDHAGKAKSSSYEAPSLTVLGTVAELTLWCDKRYGSSDGFTFQGSPISCSSA